MSKRSVRIIGRSELKQYVPYSAVHLWRLERQGRFPRRISFGANRIGWDLDEVLAWVDECKARRPQRLSKVTPPRGSSNELDTCLSKER